MGVSLPYIVKALPDHNSSYNCTARIRNSLKVFQKKVVNCIIGEKKWQCQRRIRTSHQKKLFTIILDNFYTSYNHTDFGKIEELNCG